MDVNSTITLHANVPARIPYTISRIVRYIVEDYPVPMTYVVPRNANAAIELIKLILHMYDKDIEANGEQFLREKVIPIVDRFDRIVYENIGPSATEPDEFETIPDEVLNPTQQKSLSSTDQLYTGPGPEELANGFDETAPYKKVPRQYLFHSASEKLQKDIERGRRKYEHDHGPLAPEAR